MHASTVVASMTRTATMFLLAAFAGGGAVAAQLQYATTLSGAAESPPNASPGAGSVLVTVDTTFLTMRVQANFSGLSGTTTAAHIHCCTVSPGTGTAGVATTTPTFPGFPLGVTSGAYDQTFDMTQAASFNPTFVTAQGSVANARAALFAGLAAGTAYFNVHTNVFPGGEIRGFPAPGAGGPQRTFVSTGGSDANPCSLLLPCRGFAAAVAAVAAGGEVVALDSGGYGPVTIAKSVAITAPGGVYAGISVLPGNSGVVVNGPYVTVALKGLTINGQGGDAGIDFVQGAHLTVENCEIANVGALGAAGINARAPAGKVVVRDSTVRGAPNIGIWVRQPAGGIATTLLADNVSILNSGSNGVWVGGGSPGGTAEAYLTRVTVTGNGSTGGVAADATSGPALLSIENSVVSGNGIGVSASSGAKVVVAGSALVRNASFALFNVASAATLQSRGDNVVHDNNGGGAQTSGTIGTLAPL